MAVGKIVGPFEPVVVTVGYAFVWEFFILPVSLYLAVRWVANGWAGALDGSLALVTISTCSAFHRHFSHSVRQRGMTGVYGLEPYWG